jgi:hypothetical protein
MCKEGGGGETAMETISIFLLPQGDRGIVLSVENFSSRHLGKGGQTNTQRHSNCDDSNLSYGEDNFNTTF